MTNITKTLTGLVVSCVLVTGGVIIYFALPLAIAYWIIRFVGLTVTGGM